MKRIFLLFVLAACGGGTTTDDDAGNSGDSGNDVASKDSSPSDASPTDSSSGSDGSSDGATPGDGGLGAGEVCDPNNNQCKSTLLCCNEPTHMPDAMTGYFCEQPDNTQQCPKLP